MPATIIDHTDVGAPVLSGAAAENAMYTVLKWALPQLGWTIAFDNLSNKIVFRNAVADGSGSYLRIVDGTTAYVDVRMYSTMSDIDTGANQTLSIATSRWAKSDVDSTAARAWRIYGDKQRFWLCISPRNDNFSLANSNAAPVLAFFAGDTISRTPFAHEAVLTAENSASGNFYSPLVTQQVATLGTFSGLSYEYVLARDGTTKGASFRVWGCFATNLTVANGIGTTGAWADPVSGDANIYHAWLTDNAVVRGRLPGVFIADGDVFVEASQFMFASFPSAGTPEGTLDLVALLSNASRTSTGRAFGLLLAVDSEDWVGVS